jgi:hypothetical protein
MALNVELLNKVKDAILAHPEQFNMDEWVGRGACGTTACIAGWCCALSLGGLERVRTRYFDFSRHYNVKREAQDLLGIQVPEEEDDVTYELFYSSKWPIDLDRRYQDAETPLEKAQVAAERIDRFIEQYS